MSYVPGTNVLYLPMRSFQIHCGIYQRHQTFQRQFQSKTKRATKKTGIRYLPHRIFSLISTSNNRIETFSAKRKAHTEGFGINYIARKRHYLHIGSYLKSGYLGDSKIEIIFWMFKVLLLDELARRPQLKYFGWMRARGVFLSVRRDKGFSDFLWKTIAMNLEWTQTVPVRFSSGINA